MSKVIITSQIELEELIQASVRKAFSEQSPTVPDQKESTYLSLKDASRFLNLASQTIYGLTSRRRIPFMKKGKKLYFKKSDLISWMEEGRKLSLNNLKSISSSILKNERDGK